MKQSSNVRLESTLDLLLQVFFIMHFKSAVFSPNTHLFPVIY